MRFSKKASSQICRAKIEDNLNSMSTQLDSEAVTQRCSRKRVFLEISQNSQENTCARVSFLTKGLWHKCLPVNFAKFLRTPFLTELLEISSQSEIMLHVI